MLNFLYTHILLPTDNFIMFKVHSYIVLQIDLEKNITLIRKCVYSSKIYVFIHDFMYLSGYE